MTERHGRGRFTLIETTRTAMNLFAVSRTLDECRAKNSFRIMDAGWDNADHDCGLNCRRHQADLSGHPQFRKGGVAASENGLPPETSSLFSTQNGSTNDPF